jgi:nicotinamide phosphoribosyltransferase
MFARKYYNEEMAGFSIPAAEHSTITSWGEQFETEAYENMIDKFGGPGKIFAVVSDSYDIYNAVSNIWGGTLKEKVIFNGGTLVIRPDSGDPVTVNLRILEILGEKFGFTVNSKGYKVLPSFVRIIQGDGVNLISIGQILKAITAAGWSADNIAFGMGGALLQQVNRDTFSWAMKCNAIAYADDWIPVCKKPKTDAGKASKAGRIAGLPPAYDRYGAMLNDDLKTVRERCKIV